MRSYTISFCVVMLLLLCACGKKQTPTSTEHVDTIPMLILQIQKCSRLYAAECRMRKIVTHDDRAQVQGQFMKHDYNIDLPLGQRKVAIPIEATVKAYIDFSAFSAANVRRTGQKIEVTLPDPSIVLTATRIDHKAVKQHVPLTRRNFSDEELASYERQGRQAIIDAIPQTDIVAMARESAARTLIPMLMRAGFAEQDITVSFRKDITKRDIRGMIERKDSDNGKAK
ncbi:MAG: DUF4230 domain-containing protein [Prevotella sp.]|nr:DUF4230 domain-containing protein [Prevotella sp.]